MSRKKDIVQSVTKKHGTSSFGKDPSDPWSTKSEIPESVVDEGITSNRKSLLDRFLKSKGYNSTFITKDQKDSHAKGGEFIKWKRDHGVYEATIDEDSFADSQAATQQVNGGPEDAEPKQSRQSKSCFVVKSLHKKRVNEDMYDWEKSNKAEKGPKRPEKKQAETGNDINDRKSNAAMVLKGGSTMTGKGRDTIEIDPMLNRRNNIPDQKGTIKSKEPK